MEVIVRLRFTTPCLGAIRGKVMDTMLRDASGTVIFMQSWWRFGLEYAAKALSTNVDAVKEIQADPRVTGSLSTFKRFYRRDQFTAHEAFDVGSTIDVAFCLPNEISLPQFKKLLEVMGRFVGISPYGFRQDFGRFEVVAATPANTLLES
jgi:predicted NAD/FAD-binding protein